MERVSIPLNITMLAMLLDFPFEDMLNRGSTSESCPFSFSFDPARIKVGDCFSYRVPDCFDDFPLVDTLVAVHEGHLLTSSNDPTTSDKRVLGTPESRPVVQRPGLLSARPRDRDVPVSP